MHFSVKAIKKDIHNAGEKDLDDESSHDADELRRSTFGGFHLHHGF